MTFPTLTAEVSWTTTPSATPSWTTEAGLRRFSINRGRRREQDRFEAGTASFVFDNRSRRLDPTNTSSALYPNVLPMKRIRVSATVGGTTYRLFTGFIDSIAQQYEKGVGSTGGDAVAVIEATDAFTMWAALELPSVFEQAVRADNPTAWWRLGESSGATVALDSSGNLRHGTYYGGAPASSIDGLVAGDADTAIQFDGVDDAIRVDNMAWPTGDWTFEFITSQFVGGVHDVIQLTCTNGAQLWVNLDGFTGQINVILSPAPDAPQGVWQSNNDVADGGTHHVIIEYNAATYTPTIYIDGVTNQTMLSSSAKVISLMTGTLIVGTADAWQGSAYYTQDLLDELAVYPAKLGSTRRDVHVSAAATAWDGDTTGERIGRVLDFADWPAGDRDLDTGRSIVTTATLNTDALTHLLDVNDTENGGFYVLGDGRVRFRDRTAAQTEAVYTTSNATFGDDLTGGELPYADIELSYSVSQVVNDAVVQSPVATGQAQDAASRLAYGHRRPPARASLAALAEDVQAAAEWWLGHSKDVDQRIENITLLPTRTDVLWAQVLGRELEERITVKRRPPGGGTVSKEALIQGVSHEGDATSRTWKTQWWLSPAETRPYWRLGTSALGSTTSTPTTRLTF